MYSDSLSNAASADSGWNCCEPSHSEYSKVGMTFFPSRCSSQSVCPVMPHPVKNETFSFNPEPTATEASDRRCRRWLRVKRITVGSSWCILTEKEPTFQGVYLGQP